MIIMPRRRSSFKILLLWMAKAWDEIKIKNLRIVLKLRRQIVKGQLNFRAAQSKEEERPIMLHNKTHLGKVARCHARFLRTNKMKLKSISCEQKEQKKKEVDHLIKKEEEIPKSTIAMSNRIQIMVCSNSTFEKLLRLSNNQLIEINSALLKKQVLLASATT